MRTDSPQSICFIASVSKRLLSSQSVRGAHERIGIEHLETRCYLSAPRAIPPFEANFFHVPAESDSTLPGRPGPLNQRAAAGAFLDLGSGLVVFRTSEAAQRRDLNGDGDKLDNVLQVFDAVANEVRNSFQQVVDDTLLDLGGGLVAFLTDEFAQGRDLNGDGDKQDDVLQSFDAVTGQVRNSGSQAIAASVVDLNGGLVAFQTAEAEQDRRLNRDRDKQDSVLQIFDAASGFVQNTGQTFG